MLITCQPSRSHTGVGSTDKIYLLVSIRPRDDELDDVTVSDAERVEPYSARQTVYIDLYKHTHTHQVGRQRGSGVGTPFR